MWNFTRIRRKTKKLRLSIIPARRLSDQPCLGQPQKGVTYHFSLPHFDELYVVEKLLISRVQMRNFPGYNVRQKSYGFQYFRREHCLSSLAWYHPQKVRTTTFLRRNLTSRTSLKSSRSQKLKYAVSAGWTKR